MKEGVPPPSVRAAQEEKRGAFRRVARKLRVLLRLRKLYLLRAELKFAPTEAQRLLALTVVIGISCGLAAVAFHLLIKVFEHHLIDPAMAAPGRSWIAWTLVSPAVGALVCGALLQYVVPNARGSGIPQVKVAFATGGGRLRLRDSAGKFLISALQIGSGSSLGREGPTVQICAGIASRLGRLAGVSPKSLRRLLPVGAAAGIAAAFNAPIAAVTFTIRRSSEISTRRCCPASSSPPPSPPSSSAACSASTPSSTSRRPTASVTRRRSSSTRCSASPPGSSRSSSRTPCSACAAGSGPCRASLPGRGPASGASSPARWRSPCSSGCTPGESPGGGYDTLGEALSGRLAVHVMLALCAAKLVATVLSYASGGAGGIFAPSLFIGGTLGGAVGTLDQTLLGHVNEPIGAFALVGMGAVFSGVIRAPMTSVLIIVEMTSGYSLILPLMIANMTAYGLARSWRPKPIYEALLEQDGIHLKASGAADALDGLRLEPLIDHDGPFLSFAPETAAAQVSHLSHGSPPRDVYPVLDRTGKLVGVITTDELGMLDAEPDLILLTNASDLMRPPTSVLASDDLGTALDRMLSIGARAVPVTDDAGHFVGLVEEATIAREYLRKQRRTASDRGEEASE